MTDDIFIKKAEQVLQQAADEVDTITGEAHLTEYQLLDASVEYGQKPILFEFVFSEVTKIRKIYVERESGRRVRAPEDDHELMRFRAMVDFSCWNKWEMLRATVREVLQDV